MNSFLRNYKVSIPVIAGVLALLAWLAFGFFGIHTLFFDKTVDEAGPVFDISTATETPDAVEIPPASNAPTEAATSTAPGDTAVEDEPTEPAVPVDTESIVEASGTFVDGVHPTSGAAVVLGNGTGQRFLRFEEFATDNGPDLSVYLVNSSAGGVNDFIDLGDLKGNIGDQNYEIPEGVDLSVYDRVEIWCVRFAVGFGNATLTAG